MDYQSMNPSMKGLESPAPKREPASALSTSKVPSKSAGPSSSGAVQTMHDGGPVTADGSYQLRAGSHVLTGPQAKMARKHALRAIGMDRLAKPADAPTAGKPSAMDAAHKKPEKKVTSGIKVRPEKNQAAKIKDKTKK